MESSKIVEQILKITNESPYGRLDMDSSEAGEIWKILNKELQQGQSLPIDSVSGCLICIMDNVEGDGLTKGMRYKILAEKDGMYCIIDDNNNLGVYGEIFFDKE